MFGNNSKAITTLFSKIEHNHSESDFLIRCFDGVVFYCHKLILQQYERFASFPHFKEFKEKSADIDYDSSLMYTVLCYVYTGCLNFKDKEKGFDVDDEQKALKTGPTVHQLVNSWSCMDYFLFDRDELKKIFRPIITTLPTSEQVDLICQASEQFADTDTEAAGVQLLITLTMECGPLTCDNFTVHEKWTELPTPCIETLIPLLSTYDSKGAFYALERWWKHSEDTRGVTFNEILGLMVMTPETFSLLFNHPYFIKMGWRFHLQESVARFWMDESDKVFAQAQSPRLALSPYIVNDQEEATFILNLPSESVIFGYVAGGKKHILQNPPSWLENDVGDIFQMSGIDGWILKAPDEDMGTELRRSGVKETIYLAERNEILISATKMRNADHSSTYYFHLQINKAERGIGLDKSKKKAEPMTFVTGRNVQVRLFMMSLTKPLELLQHPTLRQFI